MRRTCAILIAAAAAWSGWAWSQQPDPPGQARGASPKNEAYLFAHMMHGDYGRLYYTVSLDGLHWRRLNGGNRVFEEYHGHPDICRGHDGRYYLIGNRSDSAPDINFWVSGDLIRWTKYADFTPDLSHVPNYPSPLRRIGAPKMFYDSAAAQYIMTWHTSPGGYEGRSGAVLGEPANSLRSLQRPEDLLRAAPSVPLEHGHRCWHPQNRRALLRAAEG